MDNLVKVAKSTGLSSLLRCLSKALLESGKKLAGRLPATLMPRYNVPRYFQPSSHADPSSRGRGILVTRYLRPTYHHLVSDTIEETTDAFAKHDHMYESAHLDKNVCDYNCMQKKFILTLEFYFYIIIAIILLITLVIINGQNIDIWIIGRYGFYKFQWEKDIEWNFCLLMNSSVVADYIDTNYSCE